MSGLGLANLDSVCNSDRKKRVNVNKYAAGSQKGGDAYTAEVSFFLNKLYCAFVIIFITCHFKSSVLFSISSSQISTMTYNVAS